MLENRELRANARSQLRNHWLKPVLGCFIYEATLAIPSLIADALIDDAASIISLILYGPMFIGLAAFCLMFKRGQEPNIGVVFSGFKNFIHCVGMYLWFSLWVFLWALLLIIPGIVKGFGYTMSFYIFADNPRIGIRNALNLSKKISYGYRGKLFTLYLSFIGWFFLCILTLGIGFLWLVPYIQVTIANFYDELKKESIEKGICTPDDFTRVNWEIHS